MTGYRDRELAPLIHEALGQNLLALLGAHLPKARLHFWSIQGRYEVDFVITTGRYASATGLVFSAAP